MHLSVEPCRKLQAKTVSCCYNLTKTTGFIHASSSHSQPRHEEGAHNNHSSLHTTLNDKMRLGMLKITALVQASVHKEAILRILVMMVFILHVVFFNCA